MDILERETHLDAASELVKKAAENPNSEAFDRTLALAAVSALVAAAHALASVEKNIDDANDMLNLMRASLSKIEDVVRPQIGEYEPRLRVQLYQG
jgi:hypothetical protein